MGGNRDSLRTLGEERGHKDTKRLEMDHPRSTDGPDLEVVGVRIHNAREVGIIQVPLQSIPPGESLLTTSDRQPALEQIRSSLDALLVGHTLPNVQPLIQVGPIRPNSTAYPLFWLPPSAMG